MKEILKTRLDKLAENKTTIILDKLNPLSLILEIA